MAVYPRMRIFGLAIVVLGSACATPETEPAIEGPPLIVSFADLMQRVEALKAKTLTRRCLAFARLDPAEHEKTESSVIEWPQRSFRVSLAEGMPFEARDASGPALDDP